MSGRTPAIQPASVFAHHPAASRLRLVPAAAAPARPLEPRVVVSRVDGAHAAHGTCALCWTGPCQLAGTIRRHDSIDQSTDAAAERGICSRCLVSLEMLAVQFEPQLRLHIETSA